MMRMAEGENINHLKAEAEQCVYQITTSRYEDVLQYVNKAPPGTFGNRLSSHAPVRENWNISAC